MQISQKNNTYNTSFCGAKDGKNFRRNANKLIKIFKDLPPGSVKYSYPSKKAPLTLRERLWMAIFEKPRKIGEEHTTREDRRLHTQLKTIFKKFEEQEDYIDALQTGDNRPKR